MVSDQWQPEALARGRVQSQGPPSLALRAGMVRRNDVILRYYSLAFVSHCADHRSSSCIISVIFAHYFSP